VFSRDKLSFLFITINLCSIIEFLEKSLFLPDGKILLSWGEPPACGCCDHVTVCCCIFFLFLGVSFVYLFVVASFADKH